MSRRWAFFLGTLALALLVVRLDVLHAQSTNATASPAAEQVYKNIQVLKGIPADQVIPSMQFMTSSLGVRCDHCHVEGALEKDDKKPKQQARKMMQMMFALNQNSFDGEREVTCYSCHRGNIHPVGTPIIASETSASAKAAGVSAPSSQSAGGILEKYLQALGGSAALDKINTEVQKGKLDLGQGVQFPVEIFAKQPGKRSVITHLPSGDSFETVDGQSGWTLVPGRPLRNMSRGDLQAATIDADLRFAANIKALFSDLKMKPDQQIGGRPVSVIQASNPKLPPVELYFDQQSGLLTRMVRYVDSPLGRNPTQIDYSDYRDLGGAKQPFQWTVAQPQGRFTIQIDQVEVNVPVQDAKFAKPETTSAANGH
jgi:photosynthetic reaction center cytochrome c subunit